MKPILIAHRSGPKIYPEQTVMSCRDALSVGADMVEMDIQFTSDGYPVICHDPNTMRMFGVDRLVSDMSLAEFLQLRHVGDPSFCSHSLEHILSSGIAPILFHCKITGEPMYTLTKYLHEKNFDDKCVLGVQYAEDVVTVKSLSSIRTLAFMPSVTQLDSFLESETDYIRLWEDWVTEERVKRVKNAGKGLWIMAGKATAAGVGYTTEENMRMWTEMGVDGILINDVRWAKSVFQ